LFSVVPDVELRDILDTAAKLYNTHPQIEAAIRHDQMTAAGGPHTGYNQEWSYLLFSAFAGGRAAMLF